MEFNFEKLEVWQLAMDLIDEIYEITKKYPDDEKFGLTSQAKRSVSSIALNIAEGSIRGKKEFIQNLKIAIRRSYITQDDFENIKTIEPLYFKLIKLSKSLK